MHKTDMKPDAYRAGYYTFHPYMSRAYYRLSHQDPGLQTFLKVIFTLRCEIFKVVFYNIY